MPTAIFSSSRQNLHHSRPARGETRLWTERGLFPFLSKVTSGSPKKIWYVMPSAIIDRVNRVRTDRPRTPVSQDSESSAALSAIEALAGNRRDGQGFSVDGRLRRAIEN